MSIKRVATTEAAKNVSGLLRSINRNKQPIFITKHNKIVAVILPANEAMANEQ